MRIPRIGLTIALQLVPIKVRPGKIRGRSNLPEIRQGMKLLKKCSAAMVWVEDLEFLEWEVPWCCSSHRCFWFAIPVLNSGKFRQTGNGNTACLWYCRPVSFVGHHNITVRWQCLAAGRHSKLKWQTKYNE